MIGCHMWPQLFTALGYLRIRLKGKIYFDLFFPLLGAFSVTLAAYLLNVSFRFFGEGGLLTSASNLFGVLIGFFITALAAVATFSNSSVDRKLNNHGAYVKDEELTRRQFLCLLFGYLTFLSFVLFFIIMTCAAIHERLWTVQLGVAAGAVRLGSLFLFSFALSHLFCICLLGMHYLIYRLHVPAVGSVTVNRPSDDEH